MGNSKPNENSRAVDGVIQGNHGLEVVKVVTDNLGTDSPVIDNLGTDNPVIDNPAIDNLGTDNLGTDNPVTDSPGTAIVHVDKETNEITDKDSRELLTSEMVNIIMMFRLPFAEELYKGVIFRC